MRRLRVNRLLNMGGARGRNLGNTLGVLGLLYSGIQSLSSYARGEHDRCVPSPTDMNSCETFIVAHQIYVTLTVPGSNNAALTRSLLEAALGRCIKQQRGRVRPLFGVQGAAQSLSLPHQLPLVVKCTISKLIWHQTYAEPRNNCTISSRLWHQLTRKGSSFITTW